MSILKYVQRLHELPSPTGPLAEDLNPTAIRASNRQGASCAKRRSQLQKRGKYIKYDNAILRSCGDDH